MRNWWPILLTFASAGCVKTETRTWREPSLPNSPTRWAIGVAPDQAKLFSGDEAKAVLVARAYLEQKAKDAGRARPDILELRPIRADHGWNVHVTYVGFWDDEQPRSAAGYFATVQIDDSWQVTSVVGGA